MIVDNTFYPCQNGSYMPELYLQETFSISISENYEYILALKLSTFVFYSFLSLSIFAPNFVHRDRLPGYYVREIPQITFVKRKN